MTRFLFLFLLYITIAVVDCEQDDYGLINDTPIVNYLMESLPSPYENAIKFTITLNDKPAPDGTLFYLKTLPRGCGNDDIYDKQLKLEWGNGMFQYGVYANTTELPFGGCHIYLYINDTSKGILLTHLHDIVRPAPQGTYDIISFHPRILFIANRMPARYTSPLLIQVKLEGEPAREVLPFHIETKPQGCLLKEFITSTYYTDSDGTCVLNLIPSPSLEQPLNGCEMKVRLGALGTHGIHESTVTILSDDTG